MTPIPTSDASDPGSTTTPLRHRNRNYEGVAIDEGETPGAATATGHQVGCSYYSLTHRARYRVLAVATTWELAPAACVTVRWENGNETTSATHRGADPEICACAGDVDGRLSPPLPRCRCGPIGGEAVAS